MAFLPMKYMSIPCFPHAFLKLSLRPLLYGTSIYVFFLLEAVGLLSFWLVPLLSLLSGSGWELFFTFILFTGPHGIFTP